MFGVVGVGDERADGEELLTGGKRLVMVGCVGIVVV